MNESTFPTACWTILSSRAAIPRGRIRPSGLGMYVRFEGWARYVPLCTLSCRSSTFSPSPSRYCFQVTPSTPGAACRFRAKKLSLSAAGVTWCSKAVNRAPLSFLATFCTRCSPGDTLFRPCVRGVAICSVFPLVGRLPSTTSAVRYPPPLFGGFRGTTQPSDFPGTCMPGLWLPAFPDRPSPPSGEGIPGISRFPRKESPHMLRVSDCAGPDGNSRIPLPSVLPSASLNSVGVLNWSISQLNTWPVCTPVNASSVTSRAPTHDSGPVWLARPSLYGSFIHNSLPVLTGTLSVRPTHLD